MAALERLKRRREFLAVAAANRKWATAGVLLQAMDRPQAGPDAPVRVGFTTTRKLGNAVVRNRVRRRLRAAADLVLKAAARGGLDLVLIGRQGSLERPFDRLCADLEQAARRLDVLVRANPASAPTLAPSRASPPPPTPRPEPPPAPRREAPRSGP